MKTKTRATIFIFLCMSIVMTQFQNCGPTPNGLIPISDEAKIVDRWNPSKLEFLASSYLVPTNVDTVNIEGLCESDLVDYVISKVTDDGFVELIDSGSASCESGTFKVAMTETSSHLLDCSEEVEIEAYLPDNQSSAKTSLKMQCF